MGVIYTTGWTREPIKHGYQRWFDSLSEGDEVCLQIFNEPTRILGFPFDTWRFELGRLIQWNETLQFRPKYGTDPSPYIKEDGSAAYSWKPDSKEWGFGVFPARIVPNSHDLAITGEGQCCSIGHMPVYEPLYLGCHRNVFLVSYGGGYHQRINELTKTYPRSYQVEVDDGMLVHLFTEEPLEGALYSQYLKP